jgi:hypothetical protein
MKRTLCPSMGSTRRIPGFGVRGSGFGFRTCPGTSWSLPATVALSMICALGGCNAPPRAGRTGDMPLYDDVTNIMSTMRTMPWLNFDSSDPTKIDGFAVNTYLISSTTQRGVFGAGTIRVSMYEDATASGTTLPAPTTMGKNVLGKKLFEWELPADKAMPFRVVRRPGRTYVMGDGYQLRLSWGNLDLAGRSIALVVEYQRTDGRLIRRAPFWLRVPSRGHI